LCSSPAAFFVKALFKLEQSVISVLSIRHKLTALITVYVFLGQQEGYKCTLFNFELLCCLTDICQQISITEIIEIFCFWLHDFVSTVSCDTLADKFFIVNSAIFKARDITASGVFH